MQESAIKRHSMAAREAQLARAMSWIGVNL